MVQNFSSKCYSCQWSKIPSKSDPCQWSKIFLLSVALVNGPKFLLVWLLSMVQNFLPNVTLPMVQSSPKCDPCQFSTVPSKCDPCQWSNTFSKCDHHQSSKMTWTDTNINKVCYLHSHMCTRTAVTHNTTQYVYLYNCYLQHYTISTRHFFHFPVGPLAKPHSTHTPAVQT